MIVKSVKEALAWPDHRAWDISSIPSHVTLFYSLLKAQCCTHWSLLWWQRPIMHYPSTEMHSSLRINAWSIYNERNGLGQFDTSPPCGNIKNDARRCTCVKHVLGLRLKLTMLWIIKSFLIWSVWFRSISSWIGEDATFLFGPEATQPCWDNAQPDRLRWEYTTSNGSEN